MVLQNGRGHIGPSKCFSIRLLSFSDKQSLLSNLKTTRLPERLLELAQQFYTSVTAPLTFRLLRQQRRLYSSSLSLKYCERNLADFLFISKFFTTIML